MEGPMLSGLLRAPPVIQARRDSVAPSISFTSSDSAGTLRILFVRKLDPRILIYPDPPFIVHLDHLDT